MSKIKSVYSCNECGAQSPKWVGQCPGWQCLEYAGRKPLWRQRPCRNVAALWRATDVPTVQSLDTVSAEKIIRISSGLAEFDRVLGGHGLVTGR